MAVLKFLQKSPIAELRQKVLDILQSSRLYIKQNDLDRIASQLGSVEIFQSFIPADTLEALSPFLAEDVNKRLEGTYIDHLLNYARVSNLVGGLEEVQQLFANTVDPVVNRILEHESRIKVFKRILGLQGEYNTIIHETFNYDNNYDGTDRRLATNTVTGTLRLNGTGKLLTTKEKSNITYE